MELKPEILTHPNIPKPLHGISPRTIMGQGWWDVERQKVYKSTDYHCIACGVHKHNAKAHKWLEAHEYWNIDYSTGRCVVESIEPLCHYCHNFIHSGRLYVCNKTFNEKSDILKHGLEILKRNNLPAFYGTINVADLLGVSHRGVKSYTPKPKNINWCDYVLVFDGIEHRSKFKNIEEWKNFYGR